MAEPPFTIGVEEEYLLVDRETRALVRDPPEEMMAQCQELLEGQVGPEFLRSQIEIGTRVCADIAGVREDLRRLRSAVAEVADRYGMAPIAASTHPFADWTQQLHTDKDRYNVLARDLGVVVRRLVISGMHVHVGIGDDETRIDLNNQVAYFLPHLLALSTSSPFWQGIDTGLKSYRLSVFNSMPRTGLPAEFSSFGEYQRHVDVLVGAGLMEDATKLWWDVRLSARYPTLEMRIADLPTRIDDTVTIAALFQLILRMLYQRRVHNQRWRAYAPMLVEENRWRAQRYGFDEPLMDFGKGKLVPYPALLDELIDLVADDADKLGCLPDVLNAREILRRGTSAHRQLATYYQALDDGADKDEALRRVVDFLIEETVAGL